MPAGRRDAMGCDSPETVTVLMARTTGVGAAPGEQGPEDGSTPISPKRITYFSRRENHVERVLMVVRYSRLCGRFRSGATIRGKFQIQF